VATGKRKACGDVIPVVSAVKRLKEGAILS